MIELEIANKKIKILYNKTENRNKTMVILNAYDPKEIEGVWSKTSLDYILVGIYDIDWNRELSPWMADSAFKNEKYFGGADKYVDILTLEIIPKVEEYLKEKINIEIDEKIIAGYSLAGLFSLYSAYKTNIFNGVISASGSLWYPKIVEFIQSRDISKNVDRIYLSLGNREEKVKNEVLKKVGENTRKIYSYYKNNTNVKCIYEENDGNHFMDSDKRVAKGINWILNNR